MGSDPEYCPMAVVRLAVGEDIARFVISLRASGFVCVPIKPTPQMIDDAWMSAVAEDAAGVWRDMVNSWECSLRSKWETRIGEAGCCHASCTPKTYP